MMMKKRIAVRITESLGKWLIKQANRMDAPRIAAIKAAGSRASELLKKNDDLTKQEMVELDSILENIGNDIIILGE